MMTLEQAKLLLDRVRAQSPDKILAASNSVALEAIDQAGSLRADLDQVAGVVKLLVKEVKAFKALLQAASEPAEEKPTAAPAVATKPPVKPAVKPPAPAPRSPLATDDDEDGKPEAFRPLVTPNTIAEARAAHARAQAEAARGTGEEGDE